MLQNLKFLARSTSRVISLKNGPMYVRYMQHVQPMQGIYMAPIRNFAYDKRVLDHYENPRNVGTFNKNDTDVGTGLVGAPACGDVMKLQIKFNEENGTIEKAVFKTFGCGSAIASSSYATELIEGMSIDDAMNIKNTDIAHHLKLPPVKLHCSMLAEDAIKAAITDYKSKKSIAGAELSQ